MMTKTQLHNYQLKAINHILNTPKCALWLEMGLGKSISTLTALEQLLYEDFDVKKVLIIAPLRVANTVWHNEAKKWEHTQKLTFSICTGDLTTRKTQLQRSADIYVINRENVPWLVEYLGNKWVFDCVVIDESSSFKNYASKRFKALRSVFGRMKRVIELTGTPASNGYMDIWSQLYLLDKGEALGKNITEYRSRYFTSDYMGFNYSLRRSMDKVIENNIKHMILSMSAEDYLELPPVISDVLYNKLEGDLLKKYKTLEKDMLVNMSSEDRITAMSAATLSNKLLQFCSGNIYDEVGGVVKVHSLKIDTLKEILEENQGENILVAYSYKHELEALKKEFPHAKVLDKDGKLVDEWNKGKIPLLLCHPLSAGHGLNLQEGGSIIVWYGFTWSLELYQQFNARLNRQGQKRTVRIFHIAVGDIENKLMKTLSNKEATQDGLMEAIKYGE